VPITWCECHVMPVVFLRDLLRMSSSTESSPTQSSAEQKPGDASGMADMEIDVDMDRRDNGSMQTSTSSPFLNPGMQRERDGCRGRLEAGWFSP
jgi:hypothetical protein